MEVDEQGDNDRDIDYEIKRQKAIEKNFYCKFVRINPDEKDFNIFVEICEIQSFIVKSIEKSTKKSNKKSLVDKLSNKFLQLGTKSNNPIENVVKKILPYSLACREHTSNIGSKMVTMANKVIKKNQGVLNVCPINQNL